jgi:hypothetical protein
MSPPERERLFAREESRESKEPYQLERPLHRGDWRLLVWKKQDGSL